MPRLPCSLMGEGSDYDNQTPQQASFGLPGNRAQRFSAGDSGLTSTAIQLSHYRAIEQVQQSLERAAVVGGGVELEGKPASIMSISECIQSSNALSLFSCSISLSSCFVLCFERSICISTAGSRRQLSIRKNERKGGSDEPDAPLLGEWELTVGEVDVVIGGKQRN